MKESNTSQTYQPLRRYVNDYTSSIISDEEFELIRKAFTHKKLRKKQYLLQEGEVSKFTAFVLKGALRQYWVDTKGVEHILRFAIENWWIGDRDSFANLTPSKYNIDALEDSELLLITPAQLQELRSQAPSFVEVMHKMDERNFIATQKRIHASISYTAEERYQELMKTNPDFIKRFPQNMIASYLGITPETLSRIRKQALFNK